MKVNARVCAIYNGKKYSGQKGFYAMCGGG